LYWFSIEANWIPRISINATVGNPRLLTENSFPKTNFEQIFRESTPIDRELSLRKFAPIESMCASRVWGYRVEYERVDLFHFRTRARRKQAGSIPFSDRAILVRRRCRRRHAFILFKRRAAKRFCSHLLYFIAWHPLRSKMIFLNKYTQLN